MMTGGIRIGEGAVVVMGTMGIADTGRCGCRGAIIRRLAPVVCGTWVVHRDISRRRYGATGCMAGRRGGRPTEALGGKRDAAGGFGGEGFGHEATMP